MNKLNAICGFLFLFIANGYSQDFWPLGTTGYNLDAVAENTTAISTTGGAIDGSDYVLYSQYYGSIMNSSYGLPNNGTLATGTRTYQLQAYNQANMLYLLPGQTDSLIVNFPFTFGGLSLLVFGTEGNPSMSTTVRFTDNNTLVNAAQTVPDWFNTGNTVISGFDRCGRTSGTPNFQQGQPKMFYQDIVINCANRSKAVQNIKIHNSGSSGRLCVMAMSYVGTPVFSATTSPVTCPNGKNGSAIIIPTDGLPPFTYTVNSSPVQNTGSPSGLPTGVYSYTAQDAAACPVTGTFAITPSFVTQPALSVTANFYTICAGATVSLNTSGASTYSWNSVPGTSQITVTPQSSMTYTVNGTTSVNCAVSGTVNIIVNPNPVISFSLPATMCVNVPCLTLAATPSGGNYNGLGVNNGQFCANNLAVNKSYSVTYSYTDGNACSASASASTTVYGAPAVSFFLDPLSYCINSSSVSLAGVPGGGTFSGSGTSGTVFSPSLAGQGISTITYSYTDQNGCSNIASVNAVVNPLPPITFSLSKKNFCVNAPLLALNAAPSTGTYSGKGVTSQFFSPSVAGPGTHTITYQYTDGNKCTANAFVTATVSACTGVNENPFLQINIWPNPASGLFNVEIEESCLLSVYNELGQQIISHSVDAGITKVNCESFSSGLYTIVLRSPSQTNIRKISLTR